MATEPDVTVVIPTRNRWPLLLAHALPSALRQEGVSVEVVVVDDGSRAPAASGTALEHPCVRLLRHEESIGVARARNAGIAAAKGRWIAFLDDDDLWSPRKLAAQLARAEADGAGWCYAAALAVDDRCRVLYGFPLASAEGLDRRLLHWNEVHAGGSNVACRRELLRRVGGFDPTLFQLADWDLWIRLALAAPAAALDEPLVAYVMHSGSMLLTDPRDVFREFELLTEKHRHAAEERGVVMAGDLFARWVAGGQRRAGLRRRAALTYLRGGLRHRDAGAFPRAAGAVLGDRAFQRLRSLPATGRTSRPAVRAPAWLAELCRGN